jgi:hypothetical protein
VKKVFHWAYRNPRHARNLSNFALKLLIDSHAIISSDKLFQVFTTLCEKENFLISLASAVAQGNVVRAICITKGKAHF